VFADSDVGRDRYAAVRPETDFTVDTPHPPPPLRRSARRPRRFTLPKR
jgi:hypothetical protein